MRWKQILLGSGLLGTILGVVERVTSMQTAKQAIASGANVSGSPVSVTTTAPDAPSDPAGANAVDVPGETI